MPRRDLGRCLGPRLRGHGPISAAPLVAIEPAPVEAAGVSTQAAYLYQRLNTKGVPSA